MFGSRLVTDLQLRIAAGRVHGVCGIRCRLRVVCCTWPMLSFAWPLGAYMVVSELAARRHFLSARGLNCGVNGITGDGVVHWHDLRACDFEPARDFDHADKALMAPSFVPQPLPPWRCRCATVEAPLDPPRNMCQ